MSQPSPWPSEDLLGASLPELRQHQTEADKAFLYKGISDVKNELAVAVRVGSANPTSPGDALSFVPWMSRDAGAPIGGGPQNQQQ